MANRDPEAEKAIINEYQQRKQRLDDILRKGQEISAEIAEHDVVLKTLEPMDAGRKVRASDSMHHPRHLAPIFPSQLITNQLHSLVMNLLHTKVLPASG